MTKVMVVADDAGLLDSICRYLTVTEMQVRGFGDAEPFLAAFAADPAVVVVLDVSLTVQDGFAAIAQLRAQSTAGIILLTARGHADDRIQGLACGVDTYLTKPVHLPELKAAILNLSWRVGLTTMPGMWQFDGHAWSLIAPNGIGVGLTGAEFRILTLLAAAAGSTVQREQILASLGKGDAAPDNRTIDICLSRLRKKVRRETGQVAPIRSVRGTGYVFAAPIRCRFPE